MLIPAPLELQQNGDHHQAVPVANGWLVVANVLTYWLEWCWPVGRGTGVLSVLMHDFPRRSWSGARSLGADGTTPIWAI